MQKKKKKKKKKANTRADKYANSVPKLTSNCTTTMTVKVFKCDSPSTLQKCNTPYPSLALGNNLLDADNHNLSSGYVFSSCKFSAPRFVWQCLTMKIVI